MLYRLMALVSVILIVNGCANRNSIREFTEEARPSLVAIKPLMVDLYSSCKRANKYFDKQRDCSSRQKQSREIVQYINVLDAYFQALGRLSDGSTAQFADRMKSIEKQYGQFFGASPAGATAAAGSRILKAIQSVSTGLVRDRQVSKVMREQHENVTILLSGISKLSSNYRNQVRIEKLDIRTKVRRKMYNKRYGKLHPLTKILVEDWLDYKARQSESRLKAANAAEKGLAAIAQQHEELGQKKPLYSRDGIKRFRHTVSQLKQYRQTIEKAFN